MPPLNSTKGLLILVLLASYFDVSSQTPSDMQWQNTILFKKILNDSGLVNKSVQVV